jgi:hypothetical protein
LMDEICAGAEIYYTGRSGGQYLKTAFILCDDYSELVSKSFLLAEDSAWTEKKPDGRFKNYHDVAAEVETAVAKKTPPNLPLVKALLAEMKKRRSRRNDFFHSTSLLDLSVTPRNCVEAFCDLLEYGEMLLGMEWRAAVDSTRNLATLEVLLKLDRQACCNPAITTRVNQILSNWPRNKPDTSRKGSLIALFPEDLHLRLCVTCGGTELRDRLKALLSP